MSFKLDSIFYFVHAIEFLINSTRFDFIFYFFIIHLYHCIMNLLSVTPILCIYFILTLFNDHCIYVSKSTLELFKIFEERFFYWIVKLVWCGKKLFCDLMIRWFYFVFQIILIHIDKLMKFFFLLKAIMFTMVIIW